MRSHLVKPWGQITGGDAGKTFPQQQGKSLNRVGDMFVASPYGVYANLPDGQLFKVIDEDGRVILGLTVERPDGVAQGEIVVFHPSTGTKTHYKNNGDMDIDTTENGGNVNINTVKSNITASDSVSITAPLTKITGDFEVTGDSDLGGSLDVGGDTVLAGNLGVGGDSTLTNLAVSGSAGFAGAMTSGGTDIGGGHKHGGSASAPDGPVSNTGAPI